MMSLETKINGKLITYTSIHNEGFLDENQTISLYYVEHHRMGSVYPRVIDFRVKHKRDEGAEKLSLLIYREIDKRLKKQEKDRKE